MSSTKLYAVFTEEHGRTTPGPRFGKLDDALRHVRAWVEGGTGDKISIQEPNGSWLHFHAPEESPVPKPTVSKYPTPVFDYRTLRDAASLEPDS